MTKEMINERLEAIIDAHAHHFATLVVIVLDLEGAATEESFDRMLESLEEYARRIQRDTLAEIALG